MICDNLSQIFAGGVLPAYLSTVFVKGFVIFWPAIIFAKVLVHKLWGKKLSWNESL